MDAMKQNDFYLKGLGIAIRAIGPLAVLLAALVVTLLILSAGRVWL